MSRGLLQHSFPRSPEPAEKCLRVSIEMLVVVDTICCISIRWDHMNPSRIDK